MTPLASRWSCSDGPSLQSSLSSESTAPTRRKKLSRLEEDLDYVGVPADLAVESPLASLLGSPSPSALASAGQEQTVHWLSNESIASMPACAAVLSPRKNDLASASLRMTRWLRPSTVSQVLVYHDRERYLAAGTSMRGGLVG